MANENSAITLAKLLFNKSVTTQDNKLIGTIDESMKPLDIHAMMIELILYLLSILNENATIFNLDKVNDPIVDTIKHKVNLLNMKLILEEIDFSLDPKLYRDKSDYYCEIVPKPPIYLCQNDWCVLDYRLIINTKFKLDSNMHLSKYYSFFLTNNGKIFSIRFDYV